MQRLWAALVLSALGACVAPPPPEFAAYTAAFDQTRRATAEAMDVWAPIEKAQRGPSADSFDPDDAAYIADEGRAGNTVLIERGFAAVTDYNEILTRYAAGESLSGLRTETAELAANVGALGLALGLPGPGIAVAAGVKGLQTLAQALLAVSDRAEFARAVEANSGRVDAFLAAVRAFTPDMYRVAVVHVRDRQIALLEQDRAGDAARVGEDLATFRKLLASWVLTIDEARRQVDALEAAVIAGRGARPSARQLSFWIAELNRHTDAVRLAARQISAAF